MEQTALSVNDSLLSAINSTCFSKALALAIIMKKRLPRATVNKEEEKALIQ
jgi:hypothetical protein